MPARSRALVWGYWIAWAIVVTAAVVAAGFFLSSALAPQGLCKTWAGDFPIACQVLKGFNVRALIVLGFLATYLATLLSQRLRSAYVGHAGVLVHAGWSATGLGWLIYGCFLFLADLGANLRIELARLLPPLVLAGACFWQGTQFGSSRPPGTTATRWLPAMLGIGFLALTVVQTLSESVVSSTIESIRCDMMRAKAAAQVLSVRDPGGFWVSDPTGGSLLSAFLDNTPWFLLGGVYVLTAFQANMISQGFHSGPAYFAWLRSIGGWLSRRWVYIYSLLPAVIAILLSQAPTLISWLWPTTPQSIVLPASRVVTLVLPYGILFVPVLGTAVRLWQEPFKGPPVRSGHDETDSRDALVSRSTPLAWVFFTIGALIFGNLLLLVRGLQPPQPQIPAAQSSDGSLTPVVHDTTAPEFVAFATVAFSVLVLQYAGFIELPYFCGQRRWKQLMVKKHVPALDTAETDLSKSLGGPPPASAQEAAAQVRALAKYVLTAENARWARAIPVHYIRTVSGLVSKLAEKAAVAIAAAVVGNSASGNLLQETAGWLGSLLGNSLFGG